MAHQAPATITPKRKRKEAVANAKDGEDNEEDGESGGGKSESDEDNNVRHPTRGQTPRKTKVVTLSRKARRSGDEPSYMGARLWEIDEEQQIEENLIMDL